MDPWSKQTCFGLLVRICVRILVNIPRISATPRHEPLNQSQKSSCTLIRSSSAQTGQVRPTRFWSKTKNDMGVHRGYVFRGLVQSQKKGSLIRGNSKFTAVLSDWVGTAPLHRVAAQVILLCILFFSCLRAERQVSRDTRNQSTCMCFSERDNSRIFVKHEKQNLLFPVNRYHIFKSQNSALRLRR